MFLVRVAYLTVFALELFHVLCFICHKKRVSHPCSISATRLPSTPSEITWATLRESAWWNVIFVRVQNVRFLLCLVFLSECAL